MRQNTQDTVQIQYPCTWHYRIIGLDKESLYLAALENIHKEFVYTPGKQSSGGKYHSINLAIEVQHQKERDLIFQALQRDSRIKFVL